VGANMAKASWLFVSFGESHLAVRSLIDFIVRSPRSDLPCLELISSKIVNLYLFTHVDGVVGG
jgi:hypothetical protein